VNRPVSTVTFALVLVLIALVSSSPASAEERRTVGAYDITLGWEKTPVYPDEANAIIVRVFTSDGRPVDGLGDTVMLRVGIPQQVTETIPLTQQPGQPGVYRVDLLLPRAAPYGFNLLGEVHGQRIDEKYLSGRDGLDKVIVKGRVYPKGALWVVAFTFGSYLVGLGVFGVRALLRWRRRHSAALSVAGG
jgi:hypothetical protein